MTLPSPPFLVVPGIYNFRDVGGYALSPSASNEQHHSVRRNFIYRSATTGNVTEAGEKVLRDVCGIRTIYDLRSHREIEEQKSKGWKVPEIEDVEVVYAPVFADLVSAIQCSCAPWGV